MFNLPRLVPPQPTTQTVATRAKRERKTLLFSFLFHKVSLPFSTYTYRLLIKPLNVLSKRRIGRKKPERIVFPSFCIHSIHFTFHRKYRRAIIFEKAFSPPKRIQLPRIIRVENRARMTWRSSISCASSPSFPEFLSPVFWRFTIYSPKKPVSNLSYRSFTLTYLQQKRN